jgi:hypothetical protein
MFMIIMILCQMCCMYMRCLRGTKKRGVIDQIGGREGGCAAVSFLDADNVCHLCVSKSYNDFNMFDVEKRNLDV